MECSGDKYCDRTENGTKKRGNGSDSSRRDETGQEIDQEPEKEEEELLVQVYL